MYYQLEYLKLDVKCWVLYTSTHSSISIGILFLDEFKDPLLRDLSSMRISFCATAKVEELRDWISSYNSLPAIPTPPYFLDTIGTWLHHISNFFSRTYGKTATFPCLLIEVVSPNARASAWLHMAIASIDSSVDLAFGIPTESWVNG